MQPTAPTPMENDRALAGRTPARGRSRGLFRRRLRARSAPREDAEGLRHRHRRAAGGGAEDLSRAPIAVGAHFGVIVVLEDGFQIEVATFRSDGAYLDGRRPTEVHFSSPEEDARRRDFTINGMFFDPPNESVIDFVGGRADLERASSARSATRRNASPKIVCACCARSVSRPCSSSRSSPRPGPRWSPRRRASREISAERIREELVQIFLSPQRVRGWDLLDRSGLMAQILPEVEAMKGCEQPPQFHPEGDVFEHTRIMLELLPDEVSLPLVFSVLFHDIGKPPTSTVDENGRIRFNGHDKLGAEMTEAIMQRLRFSRAEIDATVEAVRQHMVFKDVPNMRVAKLKRFMARPTFRRRAGAAPGRLREQPRDARQLRVPESESGGVRARTDHPAAARAGPRPDRARPEARPALRRNPRSRGDAPARRHAARSRGSARVGEGRIPPSEATPKEA